MYGSIADRQGPCGADEDTEAQRGILPSSGLLSTQRYQTEGAQEVSSASPAVCPGAGRIFSHGALFTQRCLMASDDLTWGCPATPEKLEFGPSLRALYLASLLNHPKPQCTEPQLSFAPSLALADVWVQRRQNQWLRPSGCCAPLPAQASPLLPPASLSSPRTERGWNLTEGSCS